MREGHGESQRGVRTEDVKKRKAGVRRVRLEHGQRREDCCDGAHSEPRRETVAQSGGVASSSVAN
jgi:hypothetical protein